MVLYIEMAGAVGEALVICEQQCTTVVFECTTDHCATDRKAQHAILKDIFKHLLEDQLNAQ